MIQIADEHKETMLAALYLLRHENETLDLFANKKAVAAKSAKINAAIAAIEAPRASGANESWTPLSDGIYRDPINATGVVIKGDMLRTFNDFDEGVEVALSNNARLCIYQPQRTPAPAMPGPVIMPRPFTIDDLATIAKEVNRRTRQMWEESDMQSEVPQTSVGLLRTTLEVVAEMRQRPAAQGGEVTDDIR